MASVGDPGQPAAGAAGWTCPTCGRTYPAEFAVCPLDATPRADSAGRAGDPLIGEVLGRTYRIVRVLGQGGMAKLYEAEHLRIETHFAIKVIHDDLAADPSLIARFEREARAAGRIRSEHVVRLVDVLRTTDNRPCLVTELLEGEDLGALLDRVGKLPIVDAIPIARQICRAVAAAHSVGVVHRDLKPSNVFLCKGEGVPMVKVFDFGVAKMEGDEKLTRTDSVMGTAAYMAPEQARKAADAGPLADVYSVGAVIYHMLCGEPPYGSVPAVSRFALVLHEEPARPRSIDPSIPPGIEGVIQHAMARERASRIQSALDLESQLAMFDKRLTAPKLAITSDVRQTQQTQLVQPRDSAQTMELRAKLTRPVAGFVSVASCLAFGAWLAALLAVIVQPTSSGERALIDVIALGAMAGLAVLHVRMLRPSWRSLPAIARYIGPFARALLAGVTTLGALELLEHGWSSMTSEQLLAGGWRIAFAGLAGLAGLGWRRWGLDERLRRRIG
jgi:eukaryotic-like serine/threonine-protein kinase